MDIYSYTLYLDESGDDLLYSVEDFNADSGLETHCTLVGVVIPNDKKEVLKQEFKVLKRDLWNTDEVVLHSVKIRHRKGPFAIFHYDPDLYERFKKEMNRITETVDAVVFCSSLNKYLWVQKYPKKLFFKDDPYTQAFVYLLERYAHFLNAQEADRVNGKILVEKRDSRKDKALKDTYESVKEYGTQYCKKDHFARLANKIEFKKKQMNVAGLQLSDYSCYPFYVNHKYPSRDNDHYAFLEKLVYPGERNGYGHKKWPV